MLGELAEHLLTFGKRRFRPETAERFPGAFSHVPHDVDVEVLPSAGWDVESPEDGDNSAVLDYRYGHPGARIRDSRDIPSFQAIGVAHQAVEPDRVAGFQVAAALAEVFE